MNLRSVDTPAFLVDRDRVQRNCDQMREKALRSEVAFRPHVKTHKTREIARMQGGGPSEGAPGPITVSTLAEAEHLEADGFRDITYAVPIAPDKLERAAEIASRIERLNLLIDSEEALRAIEAWHAGHGGMFDVFLKIDCGYHRAGVDPYDPASVRLALAMAGSDAIEFRGLLTHAGHSYHARSVDEIRRIAAEETAALTRFRSMLIPAGLGDLVRSVGSTPTLAVVEEIKDCDEVRPGNYVFFDAFQAAIGSCRLSDCAASVMTTVVGCYPERGALIVDAGALALSKDMGPDHIDRDFGFGVVCDLALKTLPLKLRSLSQEHGKIEGDDAAIRNHPLGSRLRIIPNHSCLTAAMYPVYHVIDGEAVVDEWRPARGW
ncbi:MAG TPA: alanine racemase [Thermoanaerobaculia bacterium]|nr:alanine racemase [Thermoanaerobaculia bacterium]